MPRGSINSVHGREGPCKTCLSGLATVLALALPLTFSGFGLSLVSGLFYGLQFLPVQYMKLCDDHAHSCTGMTTQYYCYCACVCVRVCVMCVCVCTCVPTYVCVCVCDYVLKQQSLYWKEFLPLWMCQAQLYPLHAVALPPTARHELHIWPLHRDTPGQHHLLHNLLRRSPQQTQGLPRGHPSRPCLGHHVGRGHV